MTQEIRARIEERLRAAGLRLTPQRFAVMEFLVREGGHRTADQIGACVNRRFPRASRATVYNTIHRLCAVGLLRELRLQGATALYEINLEPHHHFICRLCGRLEDIPMQGLREPSRPEVAPGYHLESWELVLRGVCARCSAPSAPIQRTRSRKEYSE